jgi:hypothetical protein
MLSSVNIVLMIEDHEGIEDIKEDVFETAEIAFAGIGLI